MKYIFFGTPEFASIILNGLIEADLKPSAVVCNPDKPFGRKKIITPPVTKQIAVQHNIPVFQPETKKDLIALSPTLAKLGDFGVVAAYAKIIPDIVIKEFKLGIIGVHPSLLPKFRGPSPIQSAILSDETETGTSLFMLTPGVDDGAILAQGKVEITDKNYVDLLNELATVSLKLLISTLPKFSSGEAQMIEQDHSKATITSLFSADDGFIDETKLKAALGGNSEVSIGVWKIIRALNPEPGVYTLLDGKRTKLLAAHVENDRLVLDQIQKEGRKPETIGT